MSTNQQRTTGRPQNYKFDRGGNPVEFGPFSGEIMNNVDPTRSGRVQVYIEQFCGPDKTIKAKWRTLSYSPPFGGATPKTSTSTGPGTYGSTNNQQSYGMSFTTPDVGVEVLCFFIGGDPDKGFYTGVIPGQGINSMVPAVGATKNAVSQNANQTAYFSKSPQLPVTEINNAPTNTAINESPQFFDQPKPIHSYVASSLFQAGTVNDPIRGPITSSSQRESPTNAHGMSTPGRPIYQGGLTDKTILQKVSAGGVKPEDVNVIGRRGGHSVVMDDGDVSGKNAMIRLRTAKGHQLTMSDDGNCFYLAHANGQVWLEFGQEGTLDVYTTNSINLRSSGTVNIHADQDINFYAGNNINMRSNRAMNIEAATTFTLASTTAMTLYSALAIGIKSNGELKLDCETNGSWAATRSIVLQSPSSKVNQGPVVPTSPLKIKVPAKMIQYVMPNGSFNAGSGWVLNPKGIQSIVTRAPCHEPYPYHNQGVKVKVNLADGTNSAPPAAPTVPAGVTITKTN